LSVPQSQWCRPLAQSRVLATTIENCVLAQMDGFGSRCIDISDGGKVIIRNNILLQSNRSDNVDVIGITLEWVPDRVSPYGSVAAKGADGNGAPMKLQTIVSPGVTVLPLFVSDPDRIHSTVFEGNIIVNDLDHYPYSSPPVALVHTRSPATVNIQNDTFVRQSARIQFAWQSPEVLGLNGSHRTEGIKWGIDGTITDEGGNKLVDGRTGAGYGSYPWLPSVPMIR